MLPKLPHHPPVSRCYLIFLTQWRRKPQLSLSAQNEGDSFWIYKPRRVQLKRGRILGQAERTAVFGLPPPNTIHEKEIWTKLSKAIELRNFSYKCQKFGSSIWLQLFNAENYRWVSITLTYYKVRYHGYYLQEDKVTEVIIRNALEFHSGSKIAEELTGLSFLLKNFHRMIVVQLENRSEQERIFNLSTLFGAKVRVERLFQNKRVPQCRGCMAFDHTHNHCQPIADASSALDGFCLEKTQLHP